MVKNASACGHAIGRNDDRRKMMIVDRLRFLHRSGKMDTLCVKRTSSGPLELRHFNVMFLDMPAKDIHGIDCHWTIDVNRKNWNLILQLQLAEDVEQLLGTADRKRRDQNRSAPSGRSIDHIP